MRLASLPSFGNNRCMSDHAAALLAAGLTLTLLVGIKGEKFFQSMRDMYQARSRYKNAKTGMRAARLVFLGVLVVVFAIAWPWLHGYG